MQDERRKGHRQRAVVPALFRCCQYPASSTICVWHFAQSIDTLFCILYTLVCLLPSHTGTLMSTEALLCPILPSRASLLPSLPLHSPIPHGEHSIASIFRILETLPSV